MTIEPIPIFDADDWALTSRQADLSGGENIYPAEIERILRIHPAIAELAVVGVPDRKWGETPVVVAVRSGAVEAGELLALLDGELARYKHPHRVVFTPALPRNAMGKVATDVVREMARQETDDRM